MIFTRGGVEDTRLEAKAKDTKKIRGQGQGQPFRGQTLKKKVFTKIFQAISTKKRFPKIFKRSTKF